MEGIVQAILSIAKSLQSNALLAGEGKIWFTDTAPSGYLICNGASLVRADYVALFAVIGTTFGAADATHFNLPDLRGRVPVGKSTDTEFDALGETGGEKTHKNTSAESGVPAHSHPIVQIPAGTAWLAPYYGLNYSYTSGATYGASVGNNTAADAANAHNNIQPYITINWIIKT